MSLGFGTLARIKFYEGKVISCFRIIQTVYRIGFFFWVVGVFFLLVYGDKYSSSAGLFIPASIIMFVQVLLSLSVAKRDLNRIIMYAIFLNLFVVLPVVLSAYFSNVWSFSYIHLYTLISTVGGVVFIPKAVCFLGTKWNKSKELWGEALSLLYLVIPVRLSVYIVGSVVAELSRSNLELAVDFVTVQIFIAFISFFLSRFLLLSEKIYLERKDNNIFAVAMFLFALIVILFFMLDYVVGFNLPLTAFLLSVFFITPIVYVFTKQFEKSKVRSSTYLLIMFLFVFYGCHSYVEKINVVHLNYAVLVMVFCYLSQMRKGNASSLKNQ